jgi:hypothetical protein
MKTIDAQYRMEKEKTELQEYLRDNKLCIFCRKEIITNYYPQITEDKKRCWYFPWAKKVTKKEDIKSKSDVMWNCHYNIKKMFDDKDSGRGIIGISTNCIYTYSEPCTAEDGIKCNILRKENGNG